MAKKIDIKLDLPGTNMIAWRLEFPKMP